MVIPAHQFLKCNMWLGKFTNTGPSQDLAIKSANVPDVDDIWDKDRPSTDKNDLRGSENVFMQSPYKVPKIFALGSTSLGPFLFFSLLWTLHCLRPPCTMQTRRVERTHPLQTTQPGGRHLFLHTRPRAERQTMSQAAAWLDVNSQGVYRMPFQAILDFHSQQPLHRCS